jgi:hypothetical protein
MNEACNCIGPQNGNPVCPCRMKAVYVRDNRFLEIHDLGPVGDDYSAVDAMHLLRAVPRKPTGGLKSRIRDEMPTSAVPVGGPSWEKSIPDPGAAFITGVDFANGEDDITTVNGVKRESVHICPVCNTRSVYMTNASNVTCPDCRTTTRFKL